MVMYKMNSGQVYDINVYWQFCILQVTCFSISEKRCWVFISVNILWWLEWVFIFEELNGIWVFFSLHLIKAISCFLTCFTSHLLHQMRILSSYLTAVWTWLSSAPPRRSIPFVGRGWETTPLCERELHPAPLTAPGRTRSHTTFTSQWF